uniref:Autotransporter adhesin n=1 Tax=Histophilus somni (strain 129Pt) TaxID=205914 RepID=Q0I566_HISS1
MNKIFKTKYDVTTGQTKVVSELANNRQVASRVEAAGSQPKCGGFFGGMLGAFKVLPLALVMAGILGVNNLSFAADYIEVDSTKVGPNNYYIQHNLGNDSVHLYGWNYKKFGGEYKNFIQTILIGSGASIGASSATAIGYKANARSDATVAIGREVNSSGTQSVALGDKANASGEQSVAMGADTNAMGYASISIGGDDVGASKDQYKYARALSQTVWELYRDNKSNFNNADNYATTSQNTYQQYLADGRKSYSQNFARGRGAISIGARTIAYGDGATALGTLSIAKGNYATSIGTASGALGNSSIALGNETYIYSNNSVGLGSEIQVAADGAMAFGYQAYSGGQGSVAIGRQVLANVGFKEQQDKNDMKALYQKESKSVMSDLYAIDNFQANSKNVFVPDTTLEQGSEIHKINKNRKAGGIAIGEYVAALGTNTQAIGRMAIADGDQSTAIGAYAYTKEGKSISFGYGAKTLQSESVAIGPHATVLGRKSIALGNNAFINKRGSDEISNAIAIGNESEADFNNSVALGYRSTTKYFHNGDKKTAALSGDSAMDLDGYVPEGSSYEIANDKAAGIVSVGGWDNSRQSQVRGKKNSAVGLRRIVNVAPGALDSDVATVGQLKALNYVKREGLVVYYTVKDDGKVIKLTKDSNGNFYEVNTATGEPLKDSQPVDKSKVLVGAKGANEVIGSQDLGDKIRFGHLEKGEITATSDQAITGNQLHQLGSSILGLTVNNSDKTKFDTVQFEAVNVTDPKDKSGVTTNFKDALTKAIGAINRGYKFSADQINGTDNNTPFYLGATIEIKAGDVTKSGNTTEKYLSKNLKTEFKNDSSKATFTIGLKDDPEFKTVKLTGDPTDNQHAVNKAYVDNKLQNVSTNLHFLSVQGTDKGAGSNYNNDGAKGTHSVAIGVKASATASATSGIAIGYNAKSDAKNAVVIGTNVSIDVPNSFVLGSNNTVTQNFKDTNGAVVVIGSGTKLVESKSSIAIGAVYKVHQGKADGTLIENAAWTASIGNKNKIKNGTDIVALGNNIQALDNTDEMSSNGTKIANNDLILIGNASKATSAKESVIIGAKAEAELKAKQAVIIGHSAKAETNAVGAVAIGQGATVKTDAGNSIALGQGSEATAKEEAKKDATVSFDSTNIKFKWTRGVSSNSGDKKSVLSIGKQNNERIIKHVAAGAVDNNSTDAINGSQLYAVADEFSKLAVNVLGAEVEEASKTGFKKSNFEVAKYNGKTTASTPTEMTFKEAIAQNTTAINKGFIFGVGDSNNEQGTHYLGDKLIIKAGAVDKPSTTQDGGYVSDNIKTAYLPSKKEIVIGIKESPSFKNVLITEEIPENTSADPKKNTYDNYAVNKKYLDKRLENVGSNFTVKGDTPKDGKNTSLEINKDNNVLTINGGSNITTAVDKGSKKLTVSLNKALTGIKTIELKDDNGSHSKTIAINNKGDLVVREENGKQQDVENKIITEKNIGNQTITYKSNGGGQKVKADNKEINEYTVKLSEGFDFHKSENITVEIEDNGKITHKLNNNLKEIDSIQSGKDAKGAKISFTSTNPTNNSNEVKDKIEFTLGNTNGGDPTKFTFSEAGLDLGNKQINNIASGIGTGDATTSNIEKVLSGQFDGSSNGQSANDISKNAVNVKDLSDVAKAIIGKGLTFKGNKLTASVDGKQTQEQATLQLGGTVTIESSESVNGKSKSPDGNEQPAKDDDIKISVKPSDTDNSKDKVTLTLELNKATSVKADDERVVTSSAVANEFSKINKTIKDKADAGLKFKGNDNKEIHKKLSDTLEIVGKGLNKNQTTKFNGTNGNIAVKENKGKLEISLNRDLKGIKSISDSKNKNIATEIRFNSKNDTNSISNSLITNLTISSNGGTFEFNRKGLHINNKQITGLRSGLLEKHNGQDRERKDLNYLIGDEFKNSSIQTHAVNVGDLAKISKEIVEKGYKYVADIPSNNGNATSIELGSTISIVKWTDTPASGTGQPAVKYTGDNLTTRYTYDGGNAKIEIGFKDAPEFRKVTLSKQTYGDSEIGNEDVITKSYLEQALNSFKFNVAYDNKTVQIGRGDTLKFVKGQNIQVSLDDKKAGATPAAPAPTPTDTATASTTPTAPASGATGGAGSTSPTVAGSSSGGTNGDSAGKVVASNTPTTTPTTTPPTTTAVVTIGTTEDLKNIKSISNGEKAKIALDKESNTIKFTSGATSEDVTLRGSKLSGVSEINKAEGKGALKLADSTATLESASGNSNVALENNEATITAGKDKGSLKLEADKATLTSAKDGSSLALAKDSATVKVDDKATFTFNKNGLDLGSNKITALASGLGLQDNASGSGDSDPNKSIIDNVLAGDPDKGKTEDKNKIANNAVNVKDLSTVAKALMDKGLTFQGNDGKEVHKKLGETLSIKGEGAVGETATDNIVVRAKEGELQIGLTKNIRNIDTISIAGTGDNSGKDVFIDAEGMTTTAQLEDGTVLVNNQTAEGVSTIAKKEDGSILVNNQTAEANILSNGKNTTEVKAGEVAIKDKAGKDVVSLKVAKGEDGQDGKGATLAFTKGADDKGTGTITGLKDLDATSDGTSAANKNYVDEKVSDLDSNRPFNFYIQEGKEYTKVVKGRDGKFYDPKDLEGAKYDGSKYVTKDGETIETSLSTEDKVIIRAEPTTTPIGISNVKSGLGISELGEAEKQQLTQAVEDKKNKVSESEKALAQTTADVKSKQQALTEKTNELSQVASERPVLLMQKADLEQQLKGLGASDPRRATAQEALSKVEDILKQNDQKSIEIAKEVKTTSENLDKAKVALADSVLNTYKAQQDLANAKEALRNREFGVDKVQALLSDNSGIAEDNVATIKDVKALAKAGLSFEGNDGKRLHKDLSETLTIKGEGEFNSTETAKGNIKVEANGSGLEVKLSDKLQNLTSVETKKDSDGRSATLLSKGVMVNNDTTKEQALFSENRLAFFKDGALGLNLDGKSRALKVGEKAIISINDKGEALVSDLNEFSSGMTITNKNYVDTKNNELRTQLNNTDRTLRAGIAGSNAAAGLASVSMPGKSMLAISAAGYGGENAVAIGYSRMSDNGKIMLQLQGNRNSRGKAAGSVSIGYQW